MIHPRRQQQRFTTPDRNSIVQPHDAQLGRPLKHHPDHRLIVGNGFVESFGHSHLFDSEKRAIDQPGDGGEIAGHMAARLRGRGRGVEVDTRQCFGNMEFARFAIFKPAEIVDAEGGVAGCLYLGNQDAGAQGMNRSRRQKMTVPFFDRNRADQVLDGIVGDGRLELLTGHAGLNPFQDSCPRLVLDDVPGFGLEMGAGMLIGVSLRGVHLHA